jgi:hypothetical protein
LWAKGLGGAGPWLALPGGGWRLGGGDALGLGGWRGGGGGLLLTGGGKKGSVVVLFLCSTATTAFATTWGTRGRASVMGS